MYTKILDMHCFYKVQNIRVKFLKLSKSQIEELITELGFVPNDGHKLMIDGIPIKFIFED